MDRGAVACPAHQHHLGTIILDELQPQGTLGYGQGICLEAVSPSLVAGLRMLIEELQATLLHDGREGAPVLCAAEPPSDSHALHNPPLPFFGLCSPGL